VALQQREAALVGSGSSRGWRAAAPPEEGGGWQLKQRRQSAAVEAVAGAVLFSVHPLFPRWR
jgi:hypothetical protein